MLFQGSEWAFLYAEPLASLEQLFSAVVKEEGVKCIVLLLSYTVQKYTDFEIGTAHSNVENATTTSRLSCTSIRASPLSYIPMVANDDTDGQSHLDMSEHKCRIGNRDKIAVVGGRVVVAGLTTDKMLTWMETLTGPNSIVQQWPGNT